jgi:TolA-binding protein
MGMMRAFMGWPILRAGLIAILALGSAAPGCISQMRADIAENQRRLDELEDDLEAKRKELEEALAEASRVLRRNSADQGLQIQQIQQQLAIMEGQFAEVRMEMAGAAEAQAQRSLETQRQLSEVARAAGMDVPLESSEIPEKKSEHWEALEKAHRINKHSYARALARAYVARYPKDDHADNAQYMIGSSYLAQGQAAAALGEFQKVISTYRNGDAIDETLYDMSQAFLKVRACDDAGTALKALLKNHPKSPLYRQAQKELRKVKSLGPAECDDR